VVNIKATELETDDDNSPGRRARARRINSVGSGFVIHADGYIVTNAHVIEHAIEQRAIFADGREFRAEVVACEPAFDLAVLKINAGESLPTLPLGRSDDLMIGETVIAIGNPLGHQNTVTVGVVSATDRKVEISHDLVLHGLVQTDASINPGNSGGPLLNVLGQLIGVNSAICDDSEGISFAIPVDQVREVMPRLLDAERRADVECGLTLDTLDEARVTAIRPDSPADLAGLQPGDLIMAIDDRALGSALDYWFALLNRHEGDVIEMSYLRDGEDRTASLILTRRSIVAAEMTGADQSSNESVMSTATLSGTGDE
jgi:serine protease Do